MLLDKKEKFVKLTADGFGRGIISFNHDRSNDASNFKNMVWEFGEELNKWLKLNEKDSLSDDIKELTDTLFNKIIKCRVQGFIIGILDDLDQDEEIKKLRDEVNRLSDYNDELKQHNIRLANELSDKQHIIDSYESSAYRRKP